MTKEELKEIYCLNQEIKMWQKELDNIECKSLTRSQVITGMPFGSGTSDPTFDIVAERERYRKVIDGILAKIQIQRRKIMNYIDNIENSTDRQIIFFKCVSNLNWYKIARELGEGYTADCVKQRYYRRLEKDGIK